MEYTISMDKSRLFLILGVWLIVLPYLGFPLMFKNILTTLSGLAIIYLIYFFSKEDRQAKVTKPNFENFSENNDFVENKEEQK